MEATKRQTPRKRSTPTIPEFVLSLLRKQIATGSPYEHSRWDAPPRPVTIEPQRVAITVTPAMCPRAQRTDPDSGPPDVAIVACFDRQQVLTQWRATRTRWAFSQLLPPEPDADRVIAEGNDERSLALWLTPAVTR